MKASNTIQLVNLFQAERSKENAEKIVQILSDDTDQVEQLKKNFASKEDIVAMELRLINKMDTNFKALVGIMFTLAALAVTISKLIS